MQQDVTVDFYEAIILPSAVNTWRSSPEATLPALSLSNTLRVSINCWAVTGLDLCFSARKIGRNSSNLMRLLPAKNMVSLIGCTLVSNFSVFGVIHPLNRPILKMTNSAPSYIFKSTRCHQMHCNSEECETRWWSYIYRNFTTPSFDDKLHYTLPLTTWKSKVTPLNWAELGYRSKRSKTEFFLHSKPPAFWGECKKKSATNQGVIKFFCSQKIFAWQRLLRRLGGDTTHYTITLWSREMRYTEC